MGLRIVDCPLCGSRVAVDRKGFLDHLRGQDDGSTCPMSGREMPADAGPIRESARRKRQMLAYSKEVVE